MIVLYSYDDKRQTFKKLVECDGDFVTISPAAPIVSINYDDIRVADWRACNVVYISLFKMCYKITGVEIKPGLKLILSLEADTHIKRPE